MPNIEVHSFTGGSVLDAIKSIKEIVQDLPFAKEVVITTYRDTCLDMEGNRQPFIRIYDSDKERRDELADMLKYVADVETLVLDRFEAKREKNIPPVQNP